ncbi:extracellular solute-binding protein [Paenibacillus oenotherae]|uniref:Extracellular solute-binding protein n=1 Tax=Paenibacillus oenotherae TaxID=1435645 RepID=A0ABS7D944_9BACL|nr:extracellular solute-binding protein [Paenibacillus oenotherae]MBW7476395.1 extracellular solute-binding protein [Paenibacillus oenotherae]
MRTRISAILIILLGTTLAAGCSIFGKPDIETADSGISGTIKVMYWDEQSFMNKYGYLFMAEHKNIDIEVVSTSGLHNYDSSEIPNLNAAYHKLIEEEKPDVIMVGIDDLEKLAADGALYDLEPSIMRDKFDIENIHPTIIEYLRKKGGGKLYALAPNFTSQALFINRDLFQQYGIELPPEKLSWEELFLTAMRFPVTGGDRDRVYGYHNGEYRNTPYHLLLTVADEMGLRMENQGTATMQTPSWKRAVELVAQLYKSGVVQVGELPKTPDMTYTEMWMLDHLFLAGRVAMTMGDPDLMRDLNEIGATEKELKFNWEILHAPSSATGHSQNFSLNEVFAINAKSTNLKAAWEFIRYSSGDEIARIRSRNPDEMWSRITHMKTKDNKSIEPFYQLSFDRNAAPVNTVYAELPQMMETAITTELNEVIADRKSVEAALEAIELEARKQIQQLNIQNK